MDPETVKAAISATSALVAVIGAIVAQRARRQSRIDMFDSQRDALILAMVANDTRCENLALQVASVRTDLQLVHPDLNRIDLPDEAAEHAKNLNDIEPITRVLDRREYSPTILDKIKYSEKNLAGLRIMARNEQVNTKLLAPEGYDLIFKNVEKYIARQQREAS